MRLLILAAMVANIGSFAFASDEVEGKSAAKGASKTPAREGERWLGAFRDERSLDPDGTIYARLNRDDGAEVLDLLTTSDHAVTRSIVGLDGTGGLGPIRKITLASPSNLSAPSISPWLDVERSPELDADGSLRKPSWGGEARPQAWRSKALARLSYDETATVALGIRRIQTFGRPPRDAVVRVQRSYHQRQREVRVSIVLAEPNEDGRFERLYVSRAGVEGTLDLAGRAVIGEIIGFRASEDQQKIFVVTTALTQYAFDIVAMDTALGFSFRGGSAEDVSQSVLVAQSTRRARRKSIEAARASCARPLTTRELEPAD